MLLIDSTLTVSMSSIFTNVPINQHNTTIIRQTLFYDFRCVLFWHAEFEQKIETFFWTENELARKLTKKDKNKPNNVPD